MNERERRPYFFNLKEDGDSAIVRLLHSSVDTIEITDSHRVSIDGKKKRIKCIGEDCPICNYGLDLDKRIYIHLFDYTDNIEKVWDRTDKIIPQLYDIQKEWSPLNTSVLKITRKGNDFPKYEIVPTNPVKYEEVDKELIDKKVAKFFYYSRGKEDLQHYIDCGSLPEKKPFVPKSEYISKKSNSEFVETHVKEENIFIDEDVDPFASLMNN